MLIPDPLRWHVNKCLCNKRKGGMDLGSVKLQLYWLGNSVGTVRVAGTPGYSETTQTDGG